MAVEQTFTLTNNLGSLIQSLDKVVISLSGGGTNATFDSTVDDEVSVSLISENQYEIRLETLEGNENTSGLITLHFTLPNEICRKTVVFTPQVFDCPPSALNGTSEQYLIFVTNGEEVNAKFSVDGTDECSIIINTI